MTTCIRRYTCRRVRLPGNKNRVQKNCQNLNFLRLTVIRFTSLLIQSLQGKKTIHYAYTEIYAYLYTQIRYFVYNYIL